MGSECEDQMLKHDELLAKLVYLFIYDGIVPTTLGLLTQP